MAAPSMVSNTVFVLIVMGVGRLFLGAWRAAAVTGRARVVVPLVVLLGWLIVPGVLSLSGALDGYGVPPPALVQIGVVTIGTYVLAFSSVGARIAESVSLAALVGFQFFRVPVEWVLHRLYTEGVIPRQMTYAGLNFDVVSGIGAAIVAMLLVAGRAGRGLVLAWNVVGFLLLANIVTVAALSTPTPFRRFMNEPANLLPSMFPYVWLPTFLVQAALFGHLLVFRALARKRTP